MKNKIKFLLAIILNGIVVINFGCGPNPFFRKVKIIPAFSFDDGPHAESLGGRLNYTENVLDILKSNSVQNNMKAVFFVQTHVSFRGGSSIGQQLITRMAKEGHIVGIHTGSTEDHPDHTILVLKLPIDVDYDGNPDGKNKLESDLIRAKGRIYELTGRYPIFVRPTYGAYNSAVLSTYKNQSLEMVLWDVESGDRTGVTPDQVKQKLKTEISAIIDSKTEVVILFHDIQVNTQANLQDYLITIKDTIIGKDREAEFITDTDTLKEILSDQSDK